jgi:uncharacterized repeat protein (TIGR01451 family)
VLENPLTDSDPSHYSLATPLPSLTPPIVQPSPPLPAPSPPTSRQRPSLRLSKVADRSRVHTGGIVRYRLRLRNVGRCPARNVRICDRLPTGLQYAADGGAQVNGRRACYTVRTLRARDSRTFTVRTRAESVARSRTLCNVATASGRAMGSRTARACIRVLPVNQPCSATAADVGRDPVSRPRAHASC